ncbi:hypothetical protein CHUAL_005432 [Chamberlinius hualienensis]
MSMATIRVQTDDQAGKSRVRRFLDYFKDLRGEVIMLFFALSNFLPVTFLQLFVLHQVCKREYPTVNCKDEINPTMETHIQQESATLLLIVYLVRIVPSFFIIMFLGPWSDLHGRRLPTLAPMIGSVITNLLYICVNEFPSWPLYSLIFATIPAGLTGDYSGFMMGYFGWINDAHSVEELTVKMSTVNGVETLMLVVVPFIGTGLYKNLGYSFVFAVASVFMTVSCILVITFIKDTKFSPAPFKTLIMDMVDCNKVAATFKVLTVKREGHKTLHMNLILLTIIPIGLAFFGHQDIIFLLVRLVAAFDIYTFTLYFTIQGIANAIGFLILGPILVSVLHFPETIIGVISNASMIAFYVATGINTSDIGFYALCALQIIGVLSLLTPRAFVSKCVLDSEKGKAMSLVGLCQSSGHIFGTFLARQIYHVTLHFYPGMFYLLAGALLIIPIAINLFVYFGTKTIKKEPLTFNLTQ